MNNSGIKINPELVRQLAEIFVRYFAIFFIILFILVSLGQYKNQGRLDLYFSLPFALSIAALGAVLAAVFIGVFRRLDAAPPWVEPSEYLKVDNFVLNRRLSRIKNTRILLFTTYLMWLPLGAFIMAINLPIWLVAYMVALVIISGVYNFSRCPRCNHYFFYRAKPGSIGDLGNEKLSLLFGMGYFNSFSSKCLNCGLKLKNESSI